MVGSLGNVFWLTLARQHGVNFNALELARRAGWPTQTGFVAACAEAAIA